MLGLEKLSLNMLKIQRVAVYNMHIKKKIRTNITIDKELLEKARKLNIPNSGFIDIELRKHRDNSVGLLLSTSV